jgi:hypothetical protein
MNRIFGRLPFQLTAGAAQSGQLAIVKVQFYKPVAAGDSFLLQDGNGNHFLADVAAAAGQSQWYNFDSFPIDLNGIGCAQLSSGQIWVYPA